MYFFEPSMVGRRFRLPSGLRPVGVLIVNCKGRAPTSPRHRSIAHVPVRRLISCGCLWFGDGFWGLAIV